MSLKRENVSSDGDSRDLKKAKSSDVDIRSLRGMEIEKVVGSGTFGVVFKATIKETGERVALKKFKLEIDPQGQGFPMQALREIRILKAVKLQNHVNIVKLFTMVTYVPEDDDEKEGASRQTTHGFAPGDVFMVFEYVDYDLSGLLKCRDVALTEMHIRSYTKQLLEGVNFLHLNKILHRDIKGPNILVTRENVIKIADLGLARSYRTLDQKFTNSNSVVTLWYRSPELLLGTNSYGPEVDIWSVGCLYAEMKVRDAILKGTTEAEQLELIYKLFGTPTGEVEELFKALPESKSEKMNFRTTYPNRVRRDPRFSRFTEGSLNLFNKLLDINPRTRITSQSALDDDYFWSGDNIPRPEDLPRFNVAVATDMSETERMKAERAAKIALEEDRIKQEKEKESGGGGGGGHSTGPGSLAGRGGRVPGRGLMGRGRQLPPSKYSVSKPVAGRGPGSLAATAVPVGAVGTTAPSSSSSSLSSKLANANANASASVRSKDGRPSIGGTSSSSKPATVTANSNSSNSSSSSSNNNSSATAGNDNDAAAHKKDVRGSSAGTSTESSQTTVDRSGSITSTGLESQSSADHKVSAEPTSIKSEGAGKSSTVD